MEPNRQMLMGVFIRGSRINEISGKFSKQHLHHFT